MKQKLLVLVSPAIQTCGVEAFTRLLARHLGADAKTRVLDADVGGLTRDLHDCSAVVFNFPIVGWKKNLFAPGLIALVTRLSGRQVLVVLHEWSGLDWKRRIVLAPVVLLASRLFFSAPEIVDEFAASPLSPLVTGQREIVPIPPNVIPQERADTVIAEGLAKARQAGRLVVAQFGSIYPKKQTQALFGALAAILARGQDAMAVFVGSFIKARDNVEADFFASARDHGVADRVQVTGYVETDAEIAGIFEEIDVFCYRFPEGLTARRGSVMAAALSGKPVVVNAPARAGALEHHPLIRRLIGAGGIHLVANDASNETVADAILAAARTPMKRLDAQEEIENLWHCIAAQFRAGAKSR